MKIAQRFQRWERGPFDNKSVKRTTEKICSCNFKFSGPASRTHLIDSSPNPTDKSGIIYLTPRRASCGAAIRAKPKARLCEPWESQVTVCQPRRGDRAIDVMTVAAAGPGMNQIYNSRLIGALFSFVGFADFCRKAAKVFLFSSAKRTE